MSLLIFDMCDFLFSCTVFVCNSFDCLHPCGYLNTIGAIDDISLNESIRLPVVHIPRPPDSYWVCDSNDGETSNTKTHTGLGLGDFVSFNLMLLAILPGSASTITKLCISIGHIISVQIGRKGTHLLGNLYRIDARPGIPLPVVMVSIYAIFLNHFIDYWSRPNLDMKWLIL